MTIPDGTLTPQEPARRGRPRRATLTDEQLFAVAGLAARGATERVIAANLGFSEDHFRTLSRRDPRAREAFESGRAQLFIALTGELVDRALDRLAPASSICLIYATKSLLGLRDSGDPPQEEVARLKVELTLPRALPLDRYNALLDEARLRLSSGESGAPEPPNAA